MGAEDGGPEAISKQVKCKAKAYSWPEEGCSGY